LQGCISLLTLLLLLLLCDRSLYHHTRSQLLLTSLTRTAALLLARKWCQVREQPAPVVSFGFCVLRR
jgi:hypothetical protein